MFNQRTYVLICFLLFIAWFIFKDSKLVRLDVSTGTLSLHFGELFGAKQPPRKAALMYGMEAKGNQGRKEEGEGEGQEEGEEEGEEEEEKEVNESGGNRRKIPSPKPTTFRFHPNFGKPTFKPTKTDDDVAVTPTLDNDDTAISVTVMFGGSRFRSSQWWSEAPTNPGDPIPTQDPTFNPNNRLKSSEYGNAARKKKQKTGEKKDVASGKDKPDEARAIAEKIVARNEAKKQRLEAQTVEKIAEKISARREAKRRKSEEKGEGEKTKKSDTKFRKRNEKEMSRKKTNKKEKKTARNRN